MIRHVVVLKWNEGVDAAHAAAAKAALDRMPASIPQIAAFASGSDLRAVPSTWDFAVTADFASLADFMAYREHPVHQEVVRNFLTDFCQRLAVQFTLD